jgi:membrane protease subunit (stomatin/prohibitin family)
MALMEFIKKQFIDVIEWNEPGDGTLAWRFPMAGNEIQHGAQLTVREAQAAVFVNEGQLADVFAPGRYRLTTSTLPVLTYLNNWDKLFQSPFKSDVHFFSTRLHLDRRWGTTQPVTIRDADFGAVRLRAFGNFSYRIADARQFHRMVSGTRERITLDELDGQLRGLLLQHISDAVASSGIPFLDLAANQVAFAAQLEAATAEDFARLGLALERVTLQNLSLPDELQQVLDQRIGMGMVGGDMGRFLQYQTAQAIPRLAEGAAGGGGGGNGGGGGSVVGDALGLGAGVALGQVMAQQLQRGLQDGAQSGAAGEALNARTASIDPEQIMATLERLAGLKDKGVVSAAEFEAKKTELLARLR